MGQRMRFGVMLIGMLWLSTLSKGHAQQNDPTHLMDALAEGEGRWSSQQLAEEALKSAPSLARSAAALERAREGAARAHTAVLPRLDLSARYTRLSRVDMGSIDIPGVPSQPFPQVLDQFALRAAVVYPVSDLFLSILPAYEAARGMADAQELRARADRDTVVLAAREALYSYARGRAAAVVAQSAVDQAKAHLADVEVMVAGGALAPVEKLRATAAVAAAEVALARSGAGVAIARDAVATMLHRELTTDFAIGEDLTRSLPALPPKQVLIEQSFSRRAEAQALAQTILALDSAVRSRESGAWPRLSLAGGFDLANPNPRIFPQEEKFKPSWDVGAILSWSPNDMLAGDRQAAETRAERAEAVANLEALRDALKLEVSQAYETCVAADRALTAATPGIVAAEESYRVRREQFRAGAAVATDVLDAEAELRSARLQLINTAIDLRVAEARLERAVSGLSAP